jgi:nucleoid-associated protein YgaU
VRHLLVLIAVAGLGLMLGCEDKNKVQQPAPPPGPTNIGEMTGEPTGPGPGVTPPPPITPTPMVRPTPTPTPTPVVRGGKTYTIQPKDTLYSIAKNQLGDGKRWKEIVEINPGLDAAKLKVGQVIKMPEK